MKIYCEECQKEVTLKDDKCPKCGTIYEIVEEKEIYGPRSGVSLAFKIIAGLIACTGLILAIVLASSVKESILVDKDAQTTEAVKLFLTYFLSFSACGLLLYGFGEIIQILHDIREKMYKK